MAQPGSCCLCPYPVWELLSYSLEACVVAYSGGLKGRMSSHSVRGACSILSPCQGYIAHNVGRQCLRGANSWRHRQLEAERAKGQSSRGQKVG